ncbi:MAG: disulfide bond formation protein B [Gammaproteobacteria bacterium]|nr:disulfide bond formation protein B [Gammaproteobacteria bacterium]MCI0590012.1 disulfide bond formation protein B [Gammaproteobacteria bacterium]
MRLNRVIYLMICLGCMGLLAFGMYLEIVKDLEPCPLCILQRLAFVLIALISLIAAIHGPRSAGVRIYSTLIILGALGGAAIAGRQVYLEHLPPEQVPECGPGLEYMLNTYPLGKTLKIILSGTGDCAEVLWTFLGLSIPTWTLICFSLIVAVSITQAVTAR